MSVRLIVFEKIDFDHIAQTNLSRPLRGGYTPIMGKKFKLVVELSYLNML